MSTATLTTEFPFSLPRGYVDGAGTVHRDGVMRLSPAQLSALLEGLDWARVHARRVSRPQAAQ